jgi:hypothetical protein
MVMVGWHLLIISLKSSCSNIDEEPNEPDYDEDKDQLEEEQEDEKETGEVAITTNTVCYGLMSKNNVDSVYIDGAIPSFIKSLKLQIGEDPDYDQVIARYRSQGLGDSWSKDMKIVPVNFNREHKAMLGNCKMILEKEGGRIATNPNRFDKLITALGTAVDDDDGTLDKEATSYDDIFDAYRLALKFYRFQ